MARKHIAIITGGLQGMGLAIAAELASRGIHVAVGARRDPCRLLRLENRADRPDPGSRT